MTNELFQAYKAKASELLTAKLPFGEHQRRAFEIIVDAEIERFAFDCRTMLSLVCQKAERKKLARKHPREPQEPKPISRPIAPKKVPGSELRRSRSDATASESRPSRTSWSVRPFPV